MSGFVSELMVFTGFVTDEVYTLPFRVIMASLAAIGVILTPIYLLSMLREIFFGKENPKLTEDRNLIDAEPREVYIIACLLLPIIGIGSFSSLGTSGAMLQMVSHGLIGASLFFLVGATYDRTKTLKLDEICLLYTSDAADE